MYKDTVVSRGYIKFMPFMTEDIDYMEDALIDIIFLIKNYLDNLILKDEYTDFLDFREHGMREHGEVVSIKEEDIINDKLYKGRQIPFYIHGKGMRMTDAIDFLEEQLNDERNVYGEELEGLVISIEEHYTTFDLTRPKINTSATVVELLYDKSYKKFNLRIKETYDFPLTTSIEQLNKSIDIFSFSLDNDKEFRPFVELIEFALRFPEATPHDVFRTQLDEKMASLIVSSVIFNKGMSELGCEPFSLEELRLLLEAHNDIEVCLGHNNALGIFRKIVPIMVDNIMVKGKIR